MTIEHRLDLADQAAALLPPLPSADDAFGYLAWEELVVSTALRLARSASPAAAGTSPTPALRVAGGRLDGAALRQLAAVVRERAGVAVARALLANAACGAFGAPAPAVRACASARTRVDLRYTTPRRRSLSVAGRQSIASLDATL